MIDWLDAYENAVDALRVSADSIERMYTAQFHDMGAEGPFCSLQSATLHHAADRLEAALP